MRGLVLLDIEGLEFNLVPSFENLDKLETATGKPIYELIFQMQQPKVGDITKALLACAVPTTGRYPDWWTREEFYKRMLKSKRLSDYAIAVATFAGNILTSGSDTDIKTVSEDGEKK